ncbi:aminotransferase class V-fold PLP-dependent enzyme [Sediminicola sp. 1XM1-17]|uniref:aminotransferase class V-fold PLP-dependent enzyme n=1 Tax=Sediminicola sp. 1XM1-17 TaxID=3127702 RepID=UPI0030783E4C
MLTSQKHLFSLEDGITYLNGAYMSPQLKSTEEIGIANLKRKSRPYSITPEDFFTQRLVLKKRFAELIAAPNYQNIAIIPSVSYGTATVANNVQLQAGDEIILVEEEFPSNVYTWSRLAENYGAHVKIVEPPRDFKDRGRIWNEAILNAITSKTSLVAMAHVHWADGTKFDLRAIREKTRAVGALLIIDGTQSIGALPFTVAELQPDALICGGYKWLMGPYSLGVAYYSDVFNDGRPLEDNWMNKLHSEDFTQLTQYHDEFQPHAGRYSVGESSNFVLVPMLINAMEQLIQWQPKQIQAYCQSISEHAVEQLREIGCFIEDNNYRGQHLFGVYLPKEREMQKIKQRLQEHHIFVSYRGKAIRVSPNVYNQKEDFDRFISCF